MNIMPMRRTSHKRALAALAAAILALAAMPAAAITYPSGRTQSANLVDLLSCCPGEDTSTQARFVWHAKPGSSCEFRYALASSENSETVVTPSVAKREGKEWLDTYAYGASKTSTTYLDYARYTVQLGNLKPGTEYVYRVKVGSSYTARQRFRTAGTTGKFDFVWMGDVHSDPSEKEKMTCVSTLLNTAKSMAPTKAIDFVLFSGDAVKFGGGYSFWQEWNGSPALADYMFAMCPGNHEYYSFPKLAYSNSSGSFNRIEDKWYLETRNDPGNGANGIGSSYWFIRNGVMFVALDSMASESYKAGATLRSEARQRQRDWFDNVVTAQSAKKSFQYLVVFQHYPYFTYQETTKDDAGNTIKWGFDRGSGDYNGWKSLFDKHQVDFAIAGDHHNYCRSKQLKGGAESSAGTVYVTAPEIGRSLYSPSVKKGSDVKNLAAYGVSASVNEDNSKFRDLMAAAHNGNESVGAVLFSVSTAEMTMKYFGTSTTPYDTVTVKAKRPAVVRDDGKFRWTGAKDGKTLSNAGNWEYGKAPGKDAEVIFTKAATVNADVNATFKSVTLNGVVTVNGSLTAKAYAGRENLVVGANATVTLSGDLSVTSDQTHLVRRVDNGGRFVVAGTVKSNGQPVYPTKEAGKGVVVVNGATVDSANWMYATENLVNGNWAVGSGGIAGTGGIWCLSDAKNSASIRPKDSNFTINVPVVIRTNFGRFELNTTGTDGKAHTITLGKSLADDGRLFVAGNGKVVCASTLAGFGDKDPYRGDVEVAGGATLAVKAGKAVTKGAVNILSGATLELPDSASGGVVHGGKVDMKSGSTLVFGGLSAGVVPLTTAQFHVLVDGMSVKFATAPAPGTYTLVKLTSSDSIVQAHLDRIHFADSTLAKRCMLAGVGTKTLVLKVSSTDLVWTGKSGNSWSAAANWLGGKAPSGTCSPYFYEGFIAGSRAVSFDKAYSVTGVLNVEAGTESAPVRFTASGSNGLSLGNKALNIGRTGPAALSVEGGSYGSINGLYLGSSGVSRLYVKSGTLSAAGWTCIGFDDSSKTSDAALVVSGGTFKSTSNNLSIGDKGAPGSKAELKVTGGTCQSAGDIIVGQRGKATLNVNGGTATASGKVVFCNVSGAFGSGEDCAANLNGGVLATKSVTYGSGNANATLTFNGGTLKALADGTLVASNGKLAVKVGKKGGIIDTNGKSVTIAAKLQDAESSGSLSFKGGGTATISGDVTYKCLTSVEAGTGLKSSTAGKTLPGNLTFASGSRLVVGAVNGDYTCFAAKGIVVAGTLNVKVEKTLGGMLPVLTMTGGGKFTQADIANVKVASADGVALVALLSDDAKSICIEPAEPNVWTGAAGNGSMKDAGNWSRKAAPGKNEKVAFRSAATVTADLGSVTLRNVSLGAVVTFNGSLRTKGIDNRANLVVGANATVTLEGDVTMAAGKQYVVRRVDTNGRFVVTGVVKSGGQEFYPTVDAGDGYVVVKGAALDGSKLMFATSDVKNANWAVGASGISGSGAVWCLSNGKNKATFRPQGSDFAINVPTVIRTAFGRYELNTTDLNGTGRTITLGGGYADNGKMFIAGKGKVVCSCVPTASNGKGAYSGAVQVEGSATLAVKSGKRLTNGNTKFCAGTSLSLPDSKSGTVELKGLTEFNSGARLVFSGLKSGVTPLKAEKINIYTSNGVGTKVTLSAGGAAPAAGTYTLFTATGQNLIAEHASRLSLDDSALSGYTVTFSLSGDKKSVQVKIAAKAKAGVAAEEAPGSRLQAAFSDWCAAPGNDGSDENAEKAFLKGEGLAEYRPLAVTGIEKVVDGEGLTRFRIRTNSDLTKANGVVYLRYGASFDAMKSVRCVVDGGDVVTEPVEDGGASGAGFFQVCIGFAEPAE